MKTKTLCDHVKYRLNADATMLQFKGNATPTWGWDRKRKADKPLLKCSVCGTTAEIPFVRYVKKAGRK